MMSDEVSQIQEVRYCLKSLRDQMAARSSKKNSPNVSRPGSPSIPSLELSDTSADRVWEENRRLHARLQEAQQRHQEEREKLLAEGARHKAQEARQANQLQQAQQELKDKEQNVEELKTLLGSLEQKNCDLNEELRANVEELEQLRVMQEEVEEKDQRLELLQRQQTNLKEKTHQLDDMLKSQQRKIRHMIEQLQNSRAVIQERERTIHDLEERVAFLEAENCQMHDQMNSLLGGQQLGPEPKAQVVYSKPIKPSSPTSKPLPFIKVIETKS